jgi:hypothetical protein
LMHGEKTFREVAPMHNLAILELCLVLKWIAEAEGKNFLFNHRA